MNKFSKITIFSAMVLTASAVLIGAVLVTNVVMAAKSPIESTGDILQILKNILNLLYSAFFIVAIIVILLAAFNYLFAKDDPEKIKSATKQIMWAVVAIAIALISVGAAQIVNTFIGK